MLYSGLRQPVRRPDTVRPETVSDPATNYSARSTMRGARILHIGAAAATTG